MGIFDEDKSRLCWFTLDSVGLSIMPDGPSDRGVSLALPSEADVHMRILKWLGIGLGVAVVLFFLVGFCLPRKFHVERGLFMNAPPESIYAVITNLREWPTWTAWTKERYPDMTIQFSGAEEGVGAKQSWDGKSSGRGSIEITKANPEEGIAYAFSFDGNPSTGGIGFFSGLDGGTLVTWHADGDMGMNPIARYFGTQMDRFMGPDFEKSLLNLKKKVEAANTIAAGVEPLDGAKAVDSSPSEDRK
jgi:uncharacterized protein YndB with AHSA1/START domain